MPRSYCSVQKKGTASNGSSSSEHVARCGLSLPLGDNEMLDANGSHRCGGPASAQCLPPRTRPARWFREIRRPGHRGRSSGRRVPPGQVVAAHRSRHDKVGLDLRPIASVTHPDGSPRVGRGGRSRHAARAPTRMNEPELVAQDTRHGTLRGRPRALRCPSARSDEATSRPMKLAPMTTAVRAVLAFSTRARLSSSVRR